jgi:hypothetical protein
VLDKWLYLAVPSIDDHHLVKKIPHLYWIKRTHNTYSWTSHLLDKNRSSHYANLNLCIHNDHTIKINHLHTVKINHLWCDSLSVDFNVRHLSTSATVVVVKSEDFELFSVERQLISYQ